MVKRKIILNLAVSLDGYICDEVGGFEWINGDGDNSLNTKEQIDFFDFLKSVDTLVMGKDAYNDCPSETMNTILKNKKKYIATHSKIENKGDDIVVISGDITNQILELQKENGKNIFIWGGAKVADSFIKENIIDEYIIGIIPIILGKGRPLFLDNNPRIKLHLLQTSTKEGIVLLKYEKR